MKTPKFLIFNFFTKGFLTQAISMPFLNRRLRSVIGDFMFLMAMYFPFGILFMVPIFFLENKIGYIESQFIIICTSIIPYSLFLFLALNKDFYNGRSVAKRLQGYQIVDSNTNKIATEMQCMIRNITFIIWPIEAFFLLISPRRRIGDIIASTKIIDVEKELPETILSEMHKIDKSKNHRRLLTLSIVIAFFISISLAGLMLTLP